MKFRGSSGLLDEMLSVKKSPKDQGDLGFLKGECSMIDKGKEKVQEKPKKMGGDANEFTQVQNKKNFKRLVPRQNTQTRYILNFVMVVSFISIDLDMELLIA